MGPRRRLADKDMVGESIDAAADLTIRYLVERNGMSATASQVLNRLEREGPMRLTLLATLEGISQPAMTQLVQRLESQELLQRSCDPDDGRAALVAIADEGRELLVVRTAARRKRLDELMAALSPDEEAALRLAAQVAMPILKKMFDIAAEKSLLARR
jgi:DNA-binding MarR family transcriptional regulator